MSRGRWSIARLFALSSRCFCSAASSALAAQDDLGGAARRAWRQGRLQARRKQRSPPSPRPATTASSPALEALGEGDLYVAQGGRRRRHRRARPADAGSDRSADRRSRRRGDQPRPRRRSRSTTRCAARSERRIGSLDADEPESGDAARGRRDRSIARADARIARCVEAALAKETGPGGPRRSWSGRAPRRSSPPTGPDAEKVAAIEHIAAQGDRDALALLTPLLSSERRADPRRPPKRASRTIKQDLAMWDAAQNVWYGLSLGSVLLLAAIGLAITFGVMGVINMAHGEMVMLGAYTTFVVQEIIRNSAPGLFDWSLAIALPARLPRRRRGRLRHRARRHPLPLRPAARDAARHLGRVAHPAAGGAHDLRRQQPRGRQPVLDVRRLRCRRPDDHLQPPVDHRLRARGLRRAPHRARAGRPSACRCAPSRRTAAWPPRWASARRGSTPSPSRSAPASPASPAWRSRRSTTSRPTSARATSSTASWSWCSAASAISGARWSARFTLGVANKFLEPYAGAVLGKILVLVFIILFIQKRPRGLFALQGRAVES